MATNATPMVVNSAAPVEFRCDALRIGRSPSKGSCRGHVVVRRDDILLCCESLEGQADAAWQWQHLTCRGDVRASQGGDLIWADFAEWNVRGQELIVQGHTKVARGDSIIVGDRVHLRLGLGRVDIDAPRGHIDREALAPSSPPGVGGGQPMPSATASAGAPSLPDICPLPPRPLDARP